MLGTKFTYNGVQHVLYLIMFIIIYTCIYISYVYL
jgi:hypothetical protein